MTRFIISIMIAVAFYSRAELPNSNSEVLDLHRIDTSLYAILPYSNSMYWMFKNARPASLSIREIDSIEVIIARAASEYNSSLESSSSGLQPLNQYKRQYVAVTGKNGQKLVWINLFCMANNVQWRRKIIDTDDGGPCYFSLIVNLCTRRYRHLYVNGKA